MYNKEKKHISDILETLCEQLDISESQYENAKEKYNAVGKWLGESNSILQSYNPQIYPQGSFKLGTVVKPLERDEFDVDLVCELFISKNAGQKQVNDLVGYWLRQNSKYEKILEPLKRGWRLNYSGNFHLDILPAIPDIQRKNGCILVPDRKLQAWKESNPIGYAKWFDERMLMRLLEMHAKAEIEQIPDDKNNFKTPLQRSVQILKRYRDVHFTKDKESAPISIVITTLAAMAYNNEDLLYDALTNIIYKIPYQIDYDGENPIVPNPTNKEENFAEKWLDNPELYGIFIKWLNDLRAKLLIVIKEARGMEKITEILSEAFGYKIMKSTMSAYAEKVDEKRMSGLLKASSNFAMLGNTGLKIRRNTFFGNG